MWLSSAVRMYLTLNDSPYLLLIVIVTLVVTYLLVSRKSGVDRRLPPALPSLPVVGSLPFLLGHRNIADYFMKTSKRLGDVFSLYAGRRFVVVLNGRGAVREALTTKGTNFASRPDDMLSHYLEHDGQKGVITPAYTPKLMEIRKQTLSILKDFGYGKRLMETRIQEQVTELVEQVREMRGKPFQPTEIVMLSVGNLMLRILYGRRFHPDEPKVRQLMDDIVKSTSLTTLELDVFPFLQHLPYYRRIKSTVRQQTSRMFSFGETQLVECLNDESRPECFVNSFIDIQGQNSDRSELLHILRDLTFAGLHTTTQTLLWSFIVLANHSSVQERLHAEIDAVIGRDRQPTLDDRKPLPYVEATILEVMRLKTLIPMSLPHLTLCDTEVNGYFVPARCMVIVNLYSVHHDPDTWQDPDQFRPERLLDDSGNLSSLKDCVIAFSLGKRSCLGEQLARQEIFLFMTGILQQYDICPPEGQDRIDDRENITTFLSTLPFEVRLIPRKT